MSETINRYKRARALADLLRDLGISNVNYEPTDDQLVKAGKAMGWERPPSTDTWMLMVHLLEEGR